MKKKRRSFPKAYLLLLTGLLLAACSREVKVSGVQCDESTFNSCGHCPNTCVVKQQMPHLHEEEEIVYSFESVELRTAFFDDIASCRKCKSISFSGQLLIDQEPKELIVSHYKISLRENCCSSE